MIAMFVGVALVALGLIALGLVLARATPAGPVHDDDEDEDVVPDAADGGPTTLLAVMDALEVRFAAQLAARRRHPSHRLRDRRWDWQSDQRRP